MKNIKKIKDNTKSLGNKNEITRDELKKLGTKEVIKCPEMGM